jgi:hypothetical protein
MRQRPIPNALSEPSKKIATENQKAKESTKK